MFKKFTQLNIKNNNNDSILKWEEPNKHFGMTKMFMKTRLKLEKNMSILEVG